MTEAQKRLLLTLANCLLEDPSACQRISRACPEPDKYRGYGEPESVIGYAILSDLIEDVEGESK